MVCSKHVQTIHIHSHQLSIRDAMSATHRKLIYCYPHYTNIIAEYESTEPCECWHARCTTLLFFKCFPFPRIFWDVTFLLLFCSQTTSSFITRALTRFFLYLLGGMVKYSQCLGKILIMSRFSYRSFSLCFLPSVSSVFSPKYWKKKLE